ncbi:hypothetical protein AB0P17_14485 [Streptomyces sp. NPDC088124]|uniref:hypothetical protein n=1 Tax=Streptomyces sp. NPDC088124 TaxID=3154654 RepID=UPI0034163EE9
MLPTEPPLSLHRLVAPTPPARVQDSGTAAATAQRRPAAEATLVPVPTKPPTALEHMLLVGQNQVGNAAVAGAAARTTPDPPPLLVVAAVPAPAPASVPKPKAVQSP